MIGGVAGAIVTYGITPVLFGVIIYLITHPEVAEKWGALLNSLASSVSSGAERRSVALDIQGRIDSFSKYANKQLAGLLPHGVKIEWVTGNITRESFLRDNKVIIKMNYHSNQDENVVLAIIEFMTKGMLPDARPHMDGKVVSAVDIISTKKMLERERRSALQYFYSEIVDPITNSDEETKNYVSILNQLDEMGYFHQIMLRELQALGAERKFALPEDSVKEETRNFVNFLDSKVVRKPRGVDVDPTFIGESIKISIVYVSKGERVTPHLDWISKCIQRNIKRIYICGIGDMNVSMVNELRQRLKDNKRLVEVYCEELKKGLFKGRKMDRICVMYNVGEDGQ